MDFFGFTLFGSLTGGALLAVAAGIFIVGLVLTIKGGDWFVDSASWFAEATGIPKFVVGATVVSFATTLPELLVSVRAAMNGSAQLAIGNAVGSVTANTTLIMGVSLVAMAVPRPYDPTTSLRLVAESLSQKSKFIRLVIFWRREVTVSRISFEISRFWQNPEKSSSIVMVLINTPFPEPFGIMFFCDFTI